MSDPSEMNDLNACMMRTQVAEKQWMTLSLRTAGGVLILFGIAACLLPAKTLDWFVGGVDGLAIWLWQYVGFLVLLSGIGYLRASKAAYRHTLFLGLALVAQVGVSLGATVLAFQGLIPTSLCVLSWVLGGIWVMPTAVVLWEAIHVEHFLASAHSEPEADEPLMELRTNTNQKLDDLADRQPQLVVFLRHAGCTFCRQALADIQSVRQEIESTGCGIVFVHLGREDDPESVAIFHKYGVDDLPRISDPSSRLYRQFGLDLGGFRELFGIKVWMRGLLFGIVNGHGIGAVRGNSFQMPGVYLYHRGIILGGFRHESAADRPDYLELANQVQSSPSGERSELAPASV